MDFKLSRNPCEKGADHAQEIPEREQPVTLRLPSLLVAMSNLLGVAVIVLLPTSSPQFADHFIPQPGFMHCLEGRRSYRIV